MREQRAVRRVLRDWGVEVDGFDGAVKDDKGKEEAKIRKSGEKKVVAKEAKGGRTGLMRVMNRFRRDGRFQTQQESNDVGME